jgi:dipeptidyl aminopeptidase/acylaminoacyl peptidase
VIARSPARSVATIKIPVLLIHGEDDTIVPPTQSESMAQALTMAGKKAVLLKLPGEDHWLSHAESRTRVLREVDTFLGAYLK